MSDISDDQIKIQAENFSFKLGGPYSQYQGNKSIGCVNHWIYVFCGLRYAEWCCVQTNGRVTESPHSQSLIANSIEWIEDKQNVFRPHFDFVKDFAWAAKEQEFYEKHVLNA